MIAQLVEVASVTELRAALASVRREGRSIGFVPTMGALHDGHAALVREARATCDVVVVSCYVNPTQFALGEDLDRYPRTPEHDAQVVAEAGADLLWRPSDADLYGSDPRDPRATTVHAGVLGDVLEGASRPGHFDGVATVVAKLLGAATPDVLLLGEKDFQQLAVVRRMVRDLLLPVRVHGVPTVRDTDGLALSSRNAYLAPDERVAALAVPRSLQAAAAWIRAAGDEPGAAVAAARTVLEREPGVELDYVELVDPDTLEPVATVGDAAVLLVAARVGTTRLIDNARLGRNQPRTEEERP